MGISERDAKEVRLRPPKIEVVPANKEVVHPVEFYRNVETEQTYCRIMDVVVPVFDPAVDENGNLDPEANKYVLDRKKFMLALTQDKESLMILRDMAIRYIGGIPSNFEGMPGTSKTFCADAFCALVGVGRYRHSFSEGTDVSDIIGRFIPDDPVLATRYTELFKMPNLTADTIAILDEAKMSGRPLTPVECAIVARNEGLPISSETRWKWADGSLPISMTMKGEHDRTAGGVFIADELNAGKPAVTVRMNAAMEMSPSLVLTEKDGKTFLRPLTPEEQQIEDAGGIVPNVVGMGRRFWFLTTQNPSGMGARQPLSRDVESRLQYRVVDPVTAGQNADNLTHLLTGEMPDIEYANKIWAGRKEVPTKFYTPSTIAEEYKRGVLVAVETDLLPKTDAEFAAIQAIPNVKVLITWLSQFQEDLVKLGPDGMGKIGAEKEERGGGYVWTRRNFERFLATIRASQKGLIDVDHLFNTGELRRNESWRDTIWEALNQEYLSGMYEEDREVVGKIVEASGILDYMGLSVNNPKPPEWIQKAKQKGINVAEGKGVYEISRLDLANADIRLDDLPDEGYMVVDDGGENVTIARRLGSLMELWNEFNPEDKGVVSKRPVVKKPDADQ